MRGSMHDKDIREFTLDAKGMHIGEPFRMVSGILAGAPIHLQQEESRLLNGMCKDDKGAS